jgi:hypothetical protein
LTDIGSYLLAVLVAGAVGSGRGNDAYGQNAGSKGMPPDHAVHTAHQLASQARPPGNEKGKVPNLAAEVAHLKEQVAELQSALTKHDMSASMPGQTPKRQMGMGSGKHGMGMMGMGGMKGGMMPGMRGMMMREGMGGAGGGMMDDMDMMAMMGGTKGMKMNMAAGLPGFPGASHIYHIGATGFFLDHPEHITLSTEQQQRLGALREQAVLAQAEAQRKMDAAEEELWQLTAADQPSLSQIESKVGEIEDLRADQRLDFIKAVGEAARVLTEPQRQALLGQMPPSGTAQAGAAMQQQPGGMGQGMEPMPPSAGMGMGDM